MRAGLNPRVTSRLASVLSGDVLIKLYPASAGSSAAVLNAAEAGTFKKTIEIRLEDSQGRLLDFLSGFDVSVSTAENVAGEDVEAPSVDNATPTIQNGITKVVVTYDTGSGKTYAENDSVSVTVAPADGTVLSDAYGVASATFTDMIAA
jgi:hypothetical protein